MSLNQRERTALEECADYNIKGHGYRWMRKTMQALERRGLVRSEDTTVGVAYFLTGEGRKALGRG
jgi:hypothetical protein